MTEKKERLTKRIENKAEALVAKTKNIAETAQKTILKAADKNQNGKLDLEDIGLNRETLQKAGEKAKEAAIVAGDGLKAGGMALKKQLAEAKLELDKKVLRPVFAEELDLGKLSSSKGELTYTVKIPRMVRLVARDKKRESSAVCAGAVGYWSTIKGVELLSLYEDAAEQINVTFFPNLAESFYYANPYLKGFYISLNDYFDYLKKARVDELRTVAQELGAKRVQIAYKEEKKIFVKEKAKATASVGTKKGAVEQEKSSKEYANIEIAADVQFSGNEEPGIPELVYFKNQSEIERLVQMRTGGNKNKVQSEVYKFQCGRMSGMSMAEAAKIDAVIAQVKCGATASLSSEVQRECRTVLEYKIDF